MYFSCRRIKVVLLVPVRVISKNLRFLKRHSKKLTARVLYQGAFTFVSTLTSVYADTDKLNAFLPQECQLRPQALYWHTRDCTITILNLAVVLYLPSVKIYHKNFYICEKCDLYQSILQISKGSQQNPSQILYSIVIYYCKATVVLLIFWYVLCPYCKIL